MSTADAFTANVPLPTGPTQDERTMAVLAHALQPLGGWGLGWLPALIIYVLRPESKFVRFHALEVMLLQAGFFLAFIVAFALVVFTFITTIVSASAQHSQPPLTLFVLFPFFWLFVVGSWVFVLVLTVVYSIKAGRGEWAQYPLFGRWAKRILKLA